MSGPGVTTFDRWLFAPVPAARLAVVRFAVFAYGLGWLVIRFPYILDVARLPERRFEPVGVLAWLERPAAVGTVVACWAVAVAGFALAAAGRWYRWTGPLAALGLLVVVTYTNSFQQVFHTENLLVIHALVLAVASPARVERTTASQGETREWVEGWPLRLLGVTVVVAYVLAGVAKLRYGGMDWVTGDALANQVAFDNVRKVLLGDIHSPVGGWLAGVGWIWPPIALATLAVELGAPMALLGRRWSTGWVVAAWCFHAGILALMAIAFPYQLLGVAYLAFLPAERLPVAARGLWARARSVTVPDPGEGGQPSPRA